jgi:hypothetical protein
MKPDGGTIAVRVQHHANPQSPAGKDGQDPIITNTATLKQGPAGSLRRAGLPSGRTR